MSDKLFFNNEIQAAIRDRDLQELFLVKIYFLGLKKSHLSSNFLAEIIKLVFENLTTNCWLNLCHAYKYKWKKWFQIFLWMYYFMHSYWILYRRRQHNYSIFSCHCCCLRRLTLLNWVLLNRDNLYFASDPSLYTQGEVFIHQKTWEPWTELLRWL